MKSIPGKNLKNATVSIKMSDKWREDLVSLLKCLEKSHPNSPKIHEFRRGLQSCNLKKAERVLPQLFEIYNQSKEHLDGNFNSWLSENTFTLKLGLRTVTLSPGRDIQDYAQHLKWTFSSFDPTLDVGNPNSMLEAAKNSGLPVSGKQLKMAMKKVQGMNPQQLSTMMQKVPQGQLEALSSNPAAEGLVTKLKEDKRAQAVAEKIQAIQGSKQ